METVLVSRRAKCDRYGALPEPAESDLRIWLWVVGLEGHFPRQELRQQRRSRHLKTGLFREGYQYRYG